MTKESIPSLLELLRWPPGQAPYAKQEEAHQRSAAERLFALFMEQRTGKTIVALENFLRQVRARHLQLMSGSVA